MTRIRKRFSHESTRMNTNQAILTTEARRKAKPKEGDPKTGKAEPLANVCEQFGAMLKESNHPMSRSPDHPMF
jgi:transposase-like protein